MNFDARLKRVEEQAQERMMADFCLCALDQEAARAFQDYLSARGVVYEPERPYIITRPCYICQRELSCDLTMLDEEERAIWHRLSDWARAGWEEKRRTGRNPEVPEAFARLEKWMKRRYRAASERVFGKHCYAAVMFAYRQAKELFPFAADWIDKAIREYDEAGTGDLNEPPPMIGQDRPGAVAPNELNESKWKQMETITT